MAGSLEGYKNSILAGMGNTTAQQAIQSETPGFNMLGNASTSNVTGMNILSPAVSGGNNYDSTATRISGLNKEVETGLGTRLDNVMSDSDKQTYLNGLTESQYKQMLQYKDEGYGFMASKALLENSYKLSDPTATGIMKYKDYAEKDAYYYNNNNNVSDFYEKYISNPVGKLANYWNNTLGYAEDAEKGNLSFVDRYANLTLGNVINGIDNIVKGVNGIIDEGESKTKTLYDRVIKGYDTDRDFYDKDREESIVDKAIDTAYGTLEAGLGALGLMPNPKALIGASLLSTKPGEFLGGITIGTLSKGVNLVLENTPIESKLYDSLSEDSKQKLSTGLAMMIVGKVAKEGNARLEVKAEPYIRATQEMVRNGLEKAGEYAKVQQGVEEFQGTKNTPYIDMETGESGIYSEFEGYKPGYRGRIASEAWEGFKEGVKEKFYREDQPSLNGIENTESQVSTPGAKKTSGVEQGNKTNNSNINSEGIVNTIGATQLRQWNRMNKVNGIKFVNRYGTDYGTWMAQRGFNQSYDNNINQLISYTEYMQDQKSKALGTITQRYKYQDVTDMLNDSISRAEYIKSDDLGKLQNLAIKNAEGGLTPSDIDYVRQWFGYNFPLKFDGTDVSGVVQRNNNMYERVKNTLEKISDENGLSQLKDINKEIAATHHIIEGTTRYYNGLSTNDVLSLKDLITLASTVANPNARPLFAVQQAIKMPKVRDAILSKLIKGKTNSERTQIKIDFDKIAKIQDEAERTRLLEEWIAKRDLKVQQATIGVDKVLPQNVVGGGVEAGQGGFITPTGPTAQQLGLGGIRETYSPQFLIKSIIEQLYEMNLIEGIDAQNAINHIMSNLSTEAQSKLANIAQKLASGKELTPEEGKIIEKVADIIRHDQDAIKKVSQKPLFEEGVDNAGENGYNTESLPTNQQSNDGTNGSERYGINPEGGDGSTQTVLRYNEDEFGAVDGGGNQETLGDNMTELGDSEEMIGRSKEILDVVDENEALDLIDNILNSDDKKVVAGNSNPNSSNITTIATGDKKAAISIDSDGEIVEFVRTGDATKESVDVLIEKAIEKGAKKINVEHEGFVEELERYGFRAVSRSGFGSYTGVYKYFMAHNGDPIDFVKTNKGQYVRNISIGRIRWFKTDIEASNYRDKLLKSNEGYGRASESLKDIDGWDGLSNYEGFDDKFKTEEDISSFLKEKFSSVNNETTNEDKALYDKMIAQSEQVVNGHINNKDMYLRYHKDMRHLNRRFKIKNTLALFNRTYVGIHVGTEDGFTLPHEYTHAMDYRFGKELTGESIKLSDLAHYLSISKNKKKTPASFKSKREELIWDFVDLYKDIHERGFSGKSNSYKGDPTERFARMGEGFFNYVKGGEMLNSVGEEYPRSVAVKYAKFLGKLDKARENGELFDGKMFDLMARGRVSRLDIPDIGEVDIEFFQEKTDM